MVRQKRSAVPKKDEPSFKDKLARLSKRPINEGRLVNPNHLNSYDTSTIFETLRWSTFLNLPNVIYPKRIKDFYESYVYNEDEGLITFRIGTKECAFSLSQMSSILNIPSTGLRFYHDSHNLTNLPPVFTHSEIISTICHKNVNPNTTILRGKDLLDDCAVWNKIMENIFPKSGNHADVSVCQAILLFALKTGTEINIMHMIAKRMSGLPSSRRDLPYGKLLTRLFQAIPDLPASPSVPGSSSIIDLATLRKMSSHSNKGKKRAHSSSTDEFEEIERFHFGDDPEEADEAESSIPLDDGMIEGSTDDRIRALNQNVNRLRNEHQGFKKEVRAFKKEVKAMFNAIMNAISCKSGGSTSAA